MRPQRTGYWCGVASIANALEVLGIRRTQREIAKLCDVTPETGTDEVEMKRALLANGVAVDEWYGDKFAEEQSWAWVKSHLLNAGPVVLCVDDEDHWVTAVGLCAGMVIVFDPSRNTGIEVHNWLTLMLRWRTADGVYYGIGVSK